MNCMKRYFNFIMLLGTVCTIASCTKNFEEINLDPNRPQNITPGVMLGQLQYRMVNASISGARNLTHELMQVTAPRASSGGGGLHRYIVNPGAGVWSNFYDQLKDVKDIYDISTKLNEDNYKAIALLYKSWAYSILTDLYGDIPYFEATKSSEGVFQPEFDSQKEIYEDILKTLDSANNLFNENLVLTYGGDLLFKANEIDAKTKKNEGIVKYRKFTNSLRLRLLLRILQKDGELNVTQQLETILNDPAKYPVFTSNTDDAIFYYPGTFPYFNPYYNARTLDWRDGTYFTKFFIDRMNAEGDPRREVWATTIQEGGKSVYKGIESGYPAEVEYAVGEHSSYRDALKTLPELGIMMTYAELEFIKSELRLKGFNTGKSAQQHYEDGIRASMMQWGATLPVGYLTQPGVVFPEISEEQQLEQIMQQKYYALFFCDYQSWFEKRRTGYPVLPRGTGIPVENKFPSRVAYPTYLQSLNPANLQAAAQAMGGDNSDVKVWWNK